MEKSSGGFGLVFFSYDIGEVTLVKYSWSEPEPLGAGERLNSVDEVEGICVCDCYATQVDFVTSTNEGVLYEI